MNESENIGERMIVSQGGGGPVPSSLGNPFPKRFAGTRNELSSEGAGGHTQELEGSC